MLFISSRPIYTIHIIGLYESDINYKWCYSATNIVISSPNRGFFTSYATINWSLKFKNFGNWKDRGKWHLVIRVDFLISFVLFHDFTDYLSSGIQSSQRPIPSFINLLLQLLVRLLKIIWDRCTASLTSNAAARMVFKLYENMLPNLVSKSLSLS